MNPGGPAEEAGKVATGFFNVMASQPVMLGLVVMNLSMVGMLYAVIRFAQDQRKTEFEMIFKTQSEVQKLLYQCVPQRSGDMKLQSDESHPVVLPPQ